MEKFKVIIVEDVPLELKGTEGILHNDIPEAEIIGTAANEPDFWRLLKQQLPVNMRNIYIEKYKVCFSCKYPLTGIIKILKGNCLIP